MSTVSAMSAVSGTRGGGVAGTPQFDNLSTVKVVKIAAVFVALLAFVAFASRHSGSPDSGLPGSGLPDSGLPDALEAGWKGGRVCEKLHEDDQIRVLRCTVPPGGGHERHSHTPHYGYVLSGGKLRIDDDGGSRIVEVATGSDFFSEGTPWHEAVNIGETTASFLVVEPKN